MRQYPRLEVNLSKLRSNTREVISRCSERGIGVCGVVKGCSAIPEVARLFLECGAEQLATSRLEQVRSLREQGIECPYMLLRVAGMSEVAELVALCELSLQSERAVLDAIEAECARQGKHHGVVIMADLGDLREGYWDWDEMVEVCCHVERDLPHVALKGIGVNLGCYGSIRPTPEKMADLLTIARRVEARIGRRLEIISGGASSSFPLVVDGTMPRGINHLRIGETILLGRDLQELWGLDNLGFLQMDAFLLRAEVLEVKEKPSYPQGEFCIDAFGNRPTYTDIGMRKRALLGFGRCEVSSLDGMVCLEEGMRLVGLTSDHCIVDVTDCRELHPGDIVSLRLVYSQMLSATARNDLPITLVEE